MNIEIDSKNWIQDYIGIPWFFLNLNIKGGNIKLDIGMANIILV
jgi:hypothetical protein